MEMGLHEQPGSLRQVRVDLHLQLTFLWISPAQYFNNSLSWDRQTNIRPPKK
jgi:hypothetical protein